MAVKTSFSDSSKLWPLIYHDVEIQIKVVYQEGFFYAYYFEMIFSTLMNFTF